MKRIRLILLLCLVFSTGIAYNQVAAETLSVSDSVKTNTEVKAELNKLNSDAAKFAIGGAKTGEDYFVGVLAGVVLVDLDLRRTMVLDDQDAPEQENLENVENLLTHVNALRESLVFYDDSEIPLCAEFQKLTREWLDVTEMLAQDYLMQLAEPFSRPDETWTDAELDFYDLYVEAYDVFIEVDDRWVDFQYEFAKPNGFVIQGVIDEDAMVDPEGEK